MKSLSEIETTVKRASKASGYSWGEAEEIGKCIRLLELFNLPGIKHLNEYYKERQKSKFEKLNIFKEKNLSTTNSFCPIILGISFLDQIKILENNKTIEFSNVAYPILFLSFLSRSSEIVGKKIQIQIDQNEILLNLNVNIYSDFMNLKFPKIAHRLKVKFQENKDNFSEDDWKSLYKLSEKTFVNETDSLKEGAAGAGLTDND
tara:strand:+ start:429 stop:1040 length:612 start_codon:yes stop_codon:yes gene_type:complete